MGTSGFFDQQHGWTSDLDPPEPAPRIAPGKVTLTSRLPGRVVQRSANGASSSTSSGPIDAIATAGVAGATSSLPYLAQIEAAFGHHDVASVRVASDGAAVEASRRLGANAYAFGDTIATAGALDLRTAAHEAAHVVQQRAGIAVADGMSTPGDAGEREAEAIADVVVAGGSAVAMLDAIAARGGGGMRAVQRDVRDTSALHPGACPTFEMWLAQFRDLPAFDNSDASDRSGPGTRGPLVLGDGAADRDARRRHGVSPTAPHPTVAPGAGDRFIDHPTEAWVRANLPEELRVTAYQLPTDCADVAAVLRHVWLVAHERTERHTLRVVHGRRREITLGLGLGATPSDRRDALHHEISGGRTSTAVSSASAAGMVQAYRDDNGAPILDWPRLAQRLHPGDMVVWEHRDLTGDRPWGGHVQTVQSIERSGATVTRVRFVAGNQPLGPDDAALIRGGHRGELGQRGMATDALREAPGRRLERQDDLRPHNAGVGSTAARWGYQHADQAGRENRGYTVALAVGPAAAVAAPRAAGAAVHLADWTARVASAASASALQATLEGALAETRAAIEGDATIAPAELTALGQAVAARATALDPVGGGATMRARLLELTEAMAAAPGSTEDAALHAGPATTAQPGNRNDPNPRQAVVRAAFAPIRTALGAATTPTATSLNQWPARLDSAADQVALDRVWADAVTAVIAIAAADPIAVAAIARHAGERVWSLARTTATTVVGDRGPAHFDAIYRMRAVTTARRAGASPPMVTSLDALDQGLDRAARGQTSIDWQRTTPGLPGAVIRHVLLTGFDPYTGGATAPGPAQWNPSGAAIMRLDGQQLTVGAEVVAIEGVVYPVSFAQFDHGIVERVVAGEAPTADAVITVSMDPSLHAAQGAVPQIEQYTVGIRQATTLTPHPTRPEPMTSETVRIPATRQTSSGAPANGAAVIDAGHRDADPAHATDLAGIAADAGIGVRDDLTLVFSAHDFARAQTALGAHATPNLREGAHALKVTDGPTAAAIVAEIRGAFTGSHAAGTSPAVDFHVGRHAFHADLVSGPGGSFLSNEVGYRTQRELAAQGVGADSFHIHTADGMTNIDTLVAQLRRVIVATIQRRQAAGRSATSTERAT